MLANLFKLFHHLRMKKLILILLVVSCAQTKKMTPKNLVFIQGVYLDGSVWKAVESKMDGKDFNMMDLGRMGRDNQTPASLTQIATESCQAIPAASILVAHSFGGAISNQMAGICPEKISKIIYVSALVPLKGEKPFDLMNKTDKANVSKVLTLGKFKTIPKGSTFYAQTDAMINSTTELPPLYPEWLSLGAEEINYDEAKFNAIPKAYIYTEKDTIISLTTQFQYTSRSGIQNSDGIPTGHYPMLSNPERLTVLIAKWSN